MHKIQNWKKSPLIYQRPLCSAPCNRKYDFGGDRIITVEQPMGRCIITVTWKIDFECDARQCPPIEICFWGQSREMRTGPWTQKLHSLKKRKEKKRKEKNHYAWHYFRAGTFSKALEIREHPTLKGEGGPVENHTFNFSLFQFGTVPQSFLHIRDIGIALKIAT